MYFVRIPAVVLALTALLSPAFAARKKTTAVAKQAPPAGIVEMPPDQQVFHALNRLAFGPRAGDVQQVRAMGAKQWAEAQLNPESIPESPILDAKLAPLTTLRMSSFEMVQKYPPVNLVRQMMNGRIPWPTDPETRFVVQRFAERYEDRLKGGKSEAPPKFAFADALAELQPEQARILQNGSVDDKLTLIAALPLNQQFDIVTSLPPGQRQKIFSAAPIDVRRRMETFQGTQRLVNQDLFDGKIFRAVYSNRQLEEVLTDFWFNHFNVFLDKGADRYLVTSYERDAIRPFVLGKFQDLLTATAQSPAMLFYLDNFESVKPDFQQNPRLAKIAPKSGLNENYGRELMELHTLGVEGGYTQKDVTEVARCFTGWTIREPRRGGGFEFNPRQHDNGEKHVLGVTIPGGGGIDDGYKVIAILAHHPATARFISRSLAVRFVSDNPPQALVDRMAAKFTSSDGDLKQVMRTMIESPEFWAQDAYRAKIKSPFEMLVSAIRATNADVQYGEMLSSELKQLGEPLYRKQEPTGYSNTSAEWLNSAALLGRMNFALNLTVNKVNGVTVTLPSTIDPDVMANSLLGAPLTADSRRIVEMQLQHPPAPPIASGAASVGAQAIPVSQTTPGPAQTTPAPLTPGLIAGLTLGSPDFQRR